MHGKKNFAKSAKLNAWLIRHMIVRSKNRISNINSIKYRIKINNAIKQDKKHDVLIQTVQLSRTKQYIMFTIIENSIAQKLIEYRNI